MKRIMLIIFLLSPQVFVSCEKERCNALWCVDIGGSGGEPVLGDVDGDGVMDVVVGSSYGNIFALRGTDGFKMWSSHQGGENLVRDIALGKINDDKGLGIFVSYNHSDVYALNGKDGTLLWLFSPGGWQIDLALGDLNGDGKLEAIVSSSSDNINESGLYVLNATDGSLLRSFIPDAGLFSIGGLGDLNGDNKMDVIITFLKWIYIPPIFPLINREDILLLNSTNYDDGLYALNGEDGSVLWYNSSISPDVCRLSIGDTNGDGKFEIVYRGYALNGENGTQLWENSSLSCVGPSLGDLDNDSRIEIVSTGNHEVFALDGENGHIIWRYSLEGEHSAPTPASIGDVDGDGKLEVVFTYGKRIFILNGEDGTLQSFYELSGNLSSPVLGDVDGDGTIDIVVGSTNGTIYAVSTGSPVPSSELLPWPMERHDPYRTGNYNFVQ